MGLALYRKYRPKRLADVVGQDTIIQTLQNSLDSNSISHAYLFTGPRGVGKTSIARILAHEINKIEYTDESTHLDIIEIDAASNRRIDEIRELRDKIHIAPTSAKYKVYIIDEVHMLTREAFNALLKTLEEPPEHAVFILATTESHKVPDTIISRTQRYTFKPISQDSAVSHLKLISKLEKIDITDDALTLLADHSNGSFRDAINLLDQLSSTAKHIDADTVRLSIGIPSEKLLYSVMDATISSDAKAIILLIQDAKVSGVHAATLAQQIASEWRSNVAEGQVSLTQEVLALLRQLSVVPSSASPYTSLELALLSYITKPTERVSTTNLEATKPTTTTTVLPEKIDTQKAIVDVPTVKDAVEPPPPKLEMQTAAKELNTSDTDAWLAILNDVKSKHNTLYGVLRMAEPVISDSTLTLSFRFAFHQKQMSQARSVEHIADSVRKIVGKDLQIVCIVIENTAPVAVEAVKPNKVQESAHINDISNIFDGAELLE